MRLRLPRPSTNRPRKRLRLPRPSIQGGTIFGCRHRSPPPRSTHVSEADLEGARAVPQRQLRRTGSSATAGTRPRCCRCSYFFVSARTIKRHHHHRLRPATTTSRRRLLGLQSNLLRRAALYLRSRHQASQAVQSPRGHPLFPVPPVLPLPPPPPPLLFSVMPVCPQHCSREP